MAKKEVAPVKRRISRIYWSKSAFALFFMIVMLAVLKSNLDSNYIYPDDYYKNKINTEDILLYKSLSGTTTKIVSYLENKPIDVLDLTVKDSGIFFRDKKTLKLYRLGF